MSVRLRRFMERCLLIVLPTTQFAYRKGLSTCNALLCVSHTLQSALRVDRRLESFRLISVQPLIGFNHQGILYRLCSDGIGSSVLSILTQFL